jgi:hypothetical protein
MDESKIYNGFSIVAQLNEQLNKRFPGGNNTKNFTDTLKDIYKPLNDGIKKNEGLFLNNEVLKEPDTAKFMILNVFNRFAALNTLLSIVDDEIYDLFIKSNKFRIYLITKGVKLYKTDTGEEKFIPIPYKHYLFPVTNERFNDFEPEYEIDRKSELIFVWPGAGFVLPKNIKTIFNPEISFPSFYINDGDHIQTIGVYENNWGVDVLASNKELCKINPITIKTDKTIRTDKTKPTVHRSQLSRNQMISPDNTTGSGNTVDFNCYDIELNEKIDLDSSEIILEIPLFTPRQDILTKITNKKVGEAPIFFTSCT